MHGNRNYTGGCNSITYGTSYPVESGSEKDGDLYIVLYENGGKKAMFLFEKDEWVCIDGVNNA